MASKSLNVPDQCSFSDEFELDDRYYIATYLVLSLLLLLQFPAVCLPRRGGGTGTVKSSPKASRNQGCQRKRERFVGHWRHQELLHLRVQSSEV